MYKIFLSFFLVFALQVQGVRAQVVDGQELRLMATNVLFGGFTTGFGAVINKNKNEAFMPTFLRGFKYGCLGGALLYTGKKCSNIIYQSNKGLVVGGWGSKIIHNAGLSIMENAALHRPVLSHYNLYVGFVRFEFDWQNEFTLQPKVMPITLGAMVYQLSNDNSKFEFGKSLMMGSPYIVARDKPAGNDGTTMRGATSLYLGTRSDKAIARHVAIANVFGLQSQEHFIFNTYMHKPMNEVRKKSKLFSDLSKYFYLDFNLMDGTYEAGRAYSKAQGCSLYNPYNFEAVKMATNKYIHWSDYCN